MRLRATAALALVILLGAAANAAQAQGKANGSKGEAAEAQKQNHKVTLEARIKKQYARIDTAVKDGKISADKADELRANLADIENSIASMKQAGGGSLNAEQHTQVANLLKQSFNQIVTASGAGTEVEQGADVLGPTWKTGKDGAQDPKALLKQMKSQEKRALRQQRQAAMQALEQQQLQYEKDMINTLGKQKPAIQDSKSQLQQVRQQSGAN